MLSAARETPGIRSVALDSTIGKVVIVGNTREAVSKARDKLYKLELQETQIDIPAAQTELVKKNLADTKAKSGVKECQLVGSGSAAKVRVLGTRVAVNVARSVLEAQISYDKKMKGLANGTQLDALVAQVSTHNTVNKPARAPVSSEPERRKADDGNFYTKEEFKEYYGGLNEWATAELEKPRPIKPPVRSAASSARSSRGASTGQVQFTRAAFIAAFGNDTEFKKYERLKSKGILPHWYKEQMSEKLQASGGASSGAATAAPNPARTPGAAPPKPVKPKAPAEPERRLADDGCMYTKEQFIEFFGGTTEWDEAAPKKTASNVFVNKPKAFQTPTRSAASSTGSRGGASSGQVQFTREAFFAAFGDDKEFKNYERLKSKGILPHWYEEKMSEKLKAAGGASSGSAPPAPTPSKPEKAKPTEPERRLADDGCMYTKAEFIEFYGGTTEWDAAAPKTVASNGNVKKQRATQAPARSADSSARPSGGASDGHVKFTREAFIEAFGDDKEFKKYERLKSKGILPHWYKEQMSEKLQAVGGVCSASTTQSSTTATAAPSAGAQTNGTSIPQTALQKLLAEQQNH